jgi:hypothetical protein
MSDPPRPDFRITVRDLAPPGDATTDVRLRRLGDTPDERR